MPDRSSPNDRKNTAEDSNPSRSSAGSRRRRKSAAPKRLIDTQGPDPSTPVDDVRLTLGVISGPHGVQGEMRMTLHTDVPEQLLDLEQVYLGDSDEPVALEGVRFHGDVALIFLDGVETPEEVKDLRGTPIRIEGRDARPLEEDEYFFYQLVGLRARTPEGRELGIVVDLIETGAHDVLVIAPEGSRPSRSPASEVLIPHHREFVHDVDPVAGIIVVTPPVYADDVQNSESNEA